DVGFAVDKLFVGREDSPAFLFEVKTGSLRGWIGCMPDITQSSLVCWNNDLQRSRRGDTV
ncbi:hypothetical protein Tco_0061841, partial [Tanacetum coccineum]